MILISQEQLKFQADLYTATNVYS